MAWSDDAAEGQHVERGSFLFCAGVPQLQIMDFG